VLGRLYAPPFFYWQRGHSTVHHRKEKEAELSGSLYMYVRCKYENGTESSGNEKKKE